MSFILCFYTIPVLIKIANKFSIYDVNNKIKKHEKSTTYLGGIALVFSFLISVSLLMPSEFRRPMFTGPYFIISIIIFLYGLGDDIFNYKPLKKLVIQLILFAILIYKSGLNLPLENFKLNSLSIIIFTIFYVAAIVNSYNLIDGADGIAISLALISCLFFAIIFYLDNKYFFCFCSVGLAGSCLAFLLYNKPPANIFMGDSGSLFIGIIIATFALISNYTENGSNNIWNDNQRILLSISSFTIPLLDMTRLFFERIKNGKHPFSGDNNHIHHLLQKIELSKNQNLTIIVCLQILSTSFTLAFIGRPIFLSLIINLVAYIVFIRLVKIKIEKLNKVKMKNEIEISVKYNAKKKLLENSNSYN